MKLLFTILLCAIVSIAASVATSRMIVQPALPKNILCSTLRNFEHVAPTILEGHRKGYILSKLVMTNNGHYFIVMERY